MNELREMRTSNFGISSWDAMGFGLICCEQIQKGPGNCIKRQCNVYSMNLLLGIQQTTFAGAQCTLKMLRTYPSLHHQSSETSLRAIPSQSRTNLVNFQQLAVIKSWSRQSIDHQDAAMVSSVMQSRSNTLHNGISSTMR